MIFFILEALFEYSALHTIRASCASWAVLRNSRNDIIVVYLKGFFEQYATRTSCAILRNVRNSRNDIIAYIEGIFSLMLLVCQIHDQIFVGELYRIAKSPSVLNDFVVEVRRLLRKLCKQNFNKAILINVKKFITSRPA